MVILAYKVIFVVSKVLSQYQQLTLVSLSHNVTRHVSLS